MDLKKLQFITIFSPTIQRQSSLSFGGNNSTPGCLMVVGNLPHCTEFTLDKENAKVLIKFLQESIVDVYKGSGKC